MKLKMTLLTGVLLGFSGLTMASPESALKQELMVPNEHQFAFELAASGVQIYDCKVVQAEQAASWQFRAPRANLSDQQGQAAGTHYAGPSWAGLDGSVVMASVLAKQDSSDQNAIPWLLLQANKHQGSGKFAEISYIQRLATVGGKAPAGTCQVGSVSEIPYTAQYRFYKKSLNKDDASAVGLIIDDAERIAKLLQKNATPDAQQIQESYLNAASPGVAIFTPYRIQNATNLANMIAKKPEEYQHAISFCLPLAKTLSDEVLSLQKQVQAHTGRTDMAPVYIVVGAGNSGGTASTDGLVLGLEVICRNKNNAAEVLTSLRAFIRHELVHVYQARSFQGPRENQLAAQILREGYADFIAELISGELAPEERERQNYGIKHESELWQALQADILLKEADQAKLIQKWMYNNHAKGREAGVPADLGYWLGKRICQAYYQRATDKAAASKALLTSFLNPLEIIQNSGYQSGRIDN